nr:MAG TPA: hypothetical protein [Caudoviricetes sp.]
MLLSFRWLGCLVRGSCWGGHPTEREHPKPKLKVDDA